MARNEKNPWKDGYYVNKNHKQLIFKVDGENCWGQKIVSFDFPERDSSFNGIWTRGEFGPACKDVEIASGKL